MNELQSLSQIFQQKIFRIPDYQRGYAWLETQLRDFWEDLINLHPDRNHYTGLLSMKLLDRAESKNLGEEDQWLLNSGYRAYHIVDGQQRLTTFVILLNEILEYVMTTDEYKNVPESDALIRYESVRDIRAKYICRKMPPMDMTTTYLFGYENDNPSAEYLRHKIFGEKFGGTLRETYYTKNLKRAKEFFARELDEYYKKYGKNGIEDLFLKLTQHLMFNIHEIEDDYDVFVAFETMNNRGKRLTNLELLKNRLIYLTTLYNKDILNEQNEVALREKINNAWKEVYYQLGRNENEPLSDDDFLRAHWIIYFSYSRKKGDDYIKFLLRKFSHKSIFEESVPAYDAEVEDEPDIDDVDEEVSDVENEVESVEEAEDSDFLRPREIADYVDSLKETAEYWYYTFFPEECKEMSEEERLWVGRLNRIGISYFRPLVAVAINPGLGTSVDERIDFLKAVERFLFINFRMAMYQSSYKSSDYYRKARELYFDKISLGDITDDLNDTSDANAQNAVESYINRMNRRFESQDGFYSWRDLRYFLYEYEYSLASKYKLYKLEWGMLTSVVKDKITIEHILPQTPTKLYWRNQFRQFSAAEVKMMSASLGNLLPLSQSINSSLQNDSFDDKKNRGYANGSHCEVEVSKEDVWNADRIYDRGMKLLEFMQKRWDFSFESKDQMEKLLHVDFVKDGRTIPDELTEDSVTEDLSNIDIGSNRHEWRKSYWTYALPVIKEAHGGDGPYSNVNPTTDNYEDGFFGVRGIHLYCSIKLRPSSARVGLWIDTGDVTSSKALFDYIYEDKNLIEDQIDKPIIWNRKEKKRACSIDIVLENVDYTDKDQWGIISGFHAKYSKMLADIIVYPRIEKIREITQ